VYIVCGNPNIKPEHSFPDHGNLLYFEIESYIFDYATVKAKSYLVALPLRQPKGTS
jgi:hypothetical protein